MMQEWYYIRDGTKRGPLTAAEVSEMLADAEIRPEDLVWKEGMPDSQSALERPEFFPPIAARAEVTTAETLAYQTPGSEKALPYETPDALDPDRIIYASVLSRIGAAIIDTIILGLVSLLLATAVAPELRDGDFIRPGLVLQPFVIWLYFALQESSAAQATLGKRLLGIVVTSSYGERIGFWRATGRHYARVLSYATFGMGLLVACFTRKSQAVHDLITRCLVIKQTRQTVA